LKGFFPTPAKVVDHMLAKLFANRSPNVDDIILDPGCGKGVFIEGIIRWCDAHRIDLPTIIGVDSNPAHTADAKKLFTDYPSVRIEERDYLRNDKRHYDFIIGNPPYVPITQLSEEEKKYYRKRYKSAIMRFDLYMLFLEEALSQLKEHGRLVFITPEKFTYVDTAKPLRIMLRRMVMEEIEMCDEDTFGQLVAYPAITTAVNEKGFDYPTRLITRSGKNREALLPKDGSSWLPYFTDKLENNHTLTLQDVCLRISCGIATGADSIFIKKTESVLPELKRFAYRTLAGRQINAKKRTMVVEDSMLIPYNRDGTLMKERELGVLGDYLGQEEIRKKLVQRTCARRKPWYAWHENPQFKDTLRPKILAKDITEVPAFMVDATGEIIPRHTVYYIIPKDPSMLQPLADYLNGPEAHAWLKANCQRAASGCLRIQSQVLKRLPVPKEFGPKIQKGQRVIHTSRLENSWDSPKT